MACFEDYEVLSILGTDLNSACYKVKNKLTSEIFVLKAINYAHFPKQVEGVLNKLKNRKLQKHNCLLEFYDHFLHEETNIIYLVTDYCKYGSIANIIQKSKKTNECFNEDFIWSLIYRLTAFIKTSSSHQKFEPLNIFDTFVDIEGNVKVLNFTLNANLEETSANIYDLGILLHQLVHVNLQYDPNEHFPEHYSKDLHNILTFLTNPEPDVSPTCEAILCHPTVLLKHTKENKVMQILVKHAKNDCDLAKSKENSNSNEQETNLQVKLENLRKREAQMKHLQEKLREQQRNVIKREKKVALMERIVKEKMTRAELYLKRARETKPLVRRFPKNDTSFSADCGDSIIVPTSQKLNLVLCETSKFSRTMSERRVRFKAHSPLKEVHNIKREIRPKKIPNQPANSKNVEPSDLENAEKKSKKKFALISMFASKKTKKPSSITSSSDSVSMHTYEEVNKGENLAFCEVKSNQNQWPEESKKQAFDLLRLMNEEDVDEIKHTFL